MNCSDARIRSTNAATSSGCRTNAARTTSAITGWSTSRSGRTTTPSATSGDGNWGTPFAPAATRPYACAVPFTLRNIKEDLEDIGSRFDGAPDLEFRAATEALELEQCGLSCQHVPPRYRFPYGH